MPLTSSDGHSTCPMPASTVQSIQWIKWIKCLFSLTFLPGHSYNSPIPSCCFYAYMPVRAPCLQKRARMQQERSHGNYLSFLLSLLAVCSLTASQQPVHWTLHQKSPPSVHLPPVPRQWLPPLFTHTAHPLPFIFFCLVLQPALALSPQDGGLAVAASFNGPVTAE